MFSANIVAVNDATHSHNPIHRDSEARSRGLRGGLVGGMTLYGYLSNPAVQTWGASWIGAGSMTARFRAPVYHGDHLQIRALTDGLPNEEQRVELMNADGVICAEATIGPPATSGPRPAAVFYPPMGPSAVLPLVNYEVLSRLPALVDHTFQIHPDDTNLTNAPLHGLAHPKNIATASIAIMYETFRAEGPRIHTGLATKHFAPVTYGDTLHARGRIIKSWRHKSRTYATNDVLISDADDKPVMHVQNTTIWELQA